MNSLATVEMMNKARLDQDFDVCKSEKSSSHRFSFITCFSLRPKRFVSFFLSVVFHTFASLKQDCHILLITKSKEQNLQSR